LPIRLKATPGDIEALTNLRVALFKDLGDIPDEKHAEVFREATYR
jgi:hypothetical protein